MKPPTFGLDGLMLPWWTVIIIMLAFVGWVWWSKR